MTAAIAFLLALALIAPQVHRFAGRAAGLLLALGPLAVFLGLAAETPRVAGGEVLAVAYSWAPRLGVELGLRLDGLALLFALLITGIGTLVVVYAGGYLEGDRLLGRFYAYLLLFMASMLGVVLADNVVVLFVFWELTSVSSYLLIGYLHEEQTSRKAALQALLVTGSGGLALLAGLVLLAQAAGSFGLAEIAQHAGATGAPDTAIVLLILVGAFTKSAQFPFHFWLPNAMAAPAPVSAYLHSATMVKAGVYLLARLHPTLGESATFTVLVTTAGLITAVLGAWLAFRHHDLKKILAYTTVSMLGLLTALIGTGSPLAIKAAMTLLLGHALYKGALFLASGAIDHGTGSRDVRVLRGLRRAMPLTAAGTGLAALSMAGLPPLVGFIGKEVLYEAALGPGPVAAALAAGGFAASALFVAIAVLVAWRPFSGTPGVTPIEPHEAPPSLWAGPLLLGIAGLLCGLFAGPTGRLLVGPAVDAVLAEPAGAKLALWHGLNAALGLSAVTLAAGLGLYLVRDRLLSAAAPLAALDDRGPARLYDWSFDAANASARWQTRQLQSGTLRRYTAIVFGTTALLVLYTLVFREGLHFPTFAGLTPYDLLWGAVMLVATLGAVMTRSRLGALVSLGVVGLGMALVFAIFGAPDLALTQILVETLTVILLIFILYRLPRFAEFSSRAARRADVAVALAAGATMTLLTLVAASIQFHPSLAPYFAENAVPLGKGRNIVNVILVDFRAFDTLGEITVIAVAAVGVLALLKLRPDTGTGGEERP